MKNAIIVSLALMVCLGGVIAIGKINVWLGLLSAFTFAIGVALLLECLPPAKGEADAE